MKKFHIIVGIISIIGIVVYYQFLWGKGGLFLIGVAIIAELIIAMVSSLKKEKVQKQ